MTGSELSGWARGDQTAHTVITLLSAVKGDLVRHELITPQGSNHENGEGSLLVVVELFSVKLSEISDQ